MIALILTAMRAIGRFGFLKLWCSAIVAAMLVPTAAMADAPDTTNKQDVAENEEGEQYTVLLDLLGVTQLVTYQNVDGKAVIGGDTIIGTHADIQRVNVRNLLTLLLQADESASADIVVPEDALKSALEALGPEGAIPPNIKIWPNRRIPYRIDSSITDVQLRSKIVDAANVWNSYGIVTFVPATSTDRKVIKIVDAPGEKWYCRASLGYMSTHGGSIELNPVCTLGAVIHEMAHSLGLMHEHQRADRGQYISVQSFVDGDSNYSIGPVSKWATVYDLCSIVHYSPEQTPKNMPPWFSLTADGERQLAACAASLPGNCRKVGQRCQPSSSDIDLLTEAYRNSR